MSWEYNEKHSPEMYSAISIENRLRYNWEYPCPPGAYAAWYMARHTVLSLRVKELHEIMTYTPDGPLRIDTSQRTPEMYAWACAIADLVRHEEECGEDARRDEIVPTPEVEP